MPRVSKKPQVRTIEILDAAEKLFNEQGYRETMVSDIVEIVGVAQGTFYYYFKSKEEVLDAIVQRRIFHMLGEIEIVLDAEMDAPCKIALVINKTINNFYGHEVLPFEYLYNDQYLHVLDKIMREGAKKIAPLLINIVEKGMQQDYFKGSYPEETVNFIIAILNCFCEDFYKRASLDQMARRLEMTKQLIETALGLPAGTLQIGFV